MTLLRIVIRIVVGKGSENIDRIDENVNEVKDIYLVSIMLYLFFFLFLLATLNRLLVLIFKDVNKFY